MQHPSCHNIHKATHTWHARRIWLWRKLVRAYKFFTYDGELFYYASSLSFYTMFAIVPLLFIVFSLMLSFFYVAIADIERFLVVNIFPTHDDELLLGFLATFLENGKKMGIVGVIVISITSLLFFRDYEYITAKMFNATPRAFVQSFIAYVLLIVFVAIALVAIFSFSVRAQALLDSASLLKGLYSKALFLQGLSWLIACVLFFTLFRISAHKTPMHKPTLIISACISGTLWFFMKHGYVYYATLNTTYATLYGSMSVLLLFMLWIYVSWFVVLGGMRVAQGISQYVLDAKQESHTSHAG